MKRPVYALIIDDEPCARECLEALLSTCVPQVKVVASTGGALTGLDAIVKLNPDIVFLDIHMPEHDGFWLAERLRKLKSNNRIIFTTAYDEHAIDAFKYAAFDFLTKPIDYEQLKSVVLRYQEEGDQVSILKKLEDLNFFLYQSRLKLKTHDGFVMVRAHEIVYCEADRNYSQIILASGEKHLISSPLLSLEEELKAFSFIRISRSHLINLDYLKRFYRCSKQALLSSEALNTTLKASSSGAKRLMEI